MLQMKRVMTLGTIQVLKDFKYCGLGMPGFEFEDEFSASALQVVARHQRLGGQRARNVSYLNCVDVLFVFRPFCLKIVARNLFNA